MSRLREGIPAPRGGEDVNRTSVATAVALR